MTVVVTVEPVVVVVVVVAATTPKEMSSHWSLYLQLLTLVLVMANDFSTQPGSQPPLAPPRLVECCVEGFLIRTKARARTSTSTSTRVGISV